LTDCHEKFHITHAKLFKIVLRLSRQQEAMKNECGYTILTRNIATENHKSLLMYQYQSVLNSHQFQSRK
jgi:hypothetical protein